MKKIILSLVLLILIFIGGWFWWNSRQMDEGASSEELTSEVYYSCLERKQIKADFFNGPASSAVLGEPPVPGGRVDLILSDGRELSLPQTISASGLRYANSDESIIFWSKGEGAFIVENNAETYSNCAERIWALESNEADKAVRSFLLSYSQLSWKTQEGSSNFCVFQNLAPERELFPYYLWVRCSEYKMENGELKELSGTSVPVKIDYPNELSYYDLSKFSISIPGDGALYDRDVKKIFPEEIWDRLHFESGPLNEKIKQEALENLK